MPIETIEHNGITYPKFQSSGNAARFVREFAMEVCKGVGVDVGCNRREWCFPYAMPVDPIMNEWDAYKLPEIYFFYNQSGIDQEVSDFDFIHSSHCLEHLTDWVKTLDYWHTRLKQGGVVFLYLPDHSQTYWRPWYNRKHLHAFTPEIIGNYFRDQPEMWKNVFVSGVDLNNSFVVIAEKV